MKRFALFGVVGFLVLGAAVYSSQTPPEGAAPGAVGGAGGELKIGVEAKNPWTHLRLNNAAEQFQFAVVTDRTGGHRAKVFSRAMAQINLLQPEFVVSVGDLIEGYTLNKERFRAEWDEFDGYTRRLEMPFFYVPGNHDLTNKALVEEWGGRYGRKYYHFVYRGVLFLAINSEDPSGTVSGAQVEYFRKVLDENRGVRWTMAFLHKPLWTAPDLTANGWGAMEAALAGRDYTVFCGHVHTFRKYLRNGANYYQLATTGGGSAMRGVEYGEFDQVAWVTMKDAKPVIAQVGLDGVMPDDLAPIVTDEGGAVAGSATGLAEVAGTVTLAGRPAENLEVVFTGLTGDAAPAAARPAGSARVLADGRFAVYQNRGAAGLKPGRYAVTLAPAAPRVVTGKPVENPVPERYRALTTTPLRVEVKADTRNLFTFDLTP